MFFLFMLVSIVAADEPYSLLRSEKSPVKIELFENVRIGRCFKNRCEAARVVRSFEPFKDEGRLESKAVNPASLLCKHLSGVTGVVYSSQKAEVSICIFSDQSFLFTWDLYAKGS